MVKVLTIDGLRSSATWWQKRMRSNRCIRLYHRYSNRCIRLLSQIYRRKRKNHEKTPISRRISRLKSRKCARTHAPSLHLSPLMVIRLPCRTHSVAECRSFFSLSLLYKKSCCIRSSVCHRWLYIERQTEARERRGTFPL